VSLETVVQFYDEGMVEHRADVLLVLNDILLLVVADESF
jgi:hypothetical protein